MLIQEFISAGRWAGTVGGILAFLFLATGSSPGSVAIDVPIIAVGVFFFRLGAPFVL